MRKLILSLAAAGTALAVATPAAAQYYPQPPYQYGGNPQFGYSAPQYGYGFNRYQTQNLMMRLNSIQQRVSDLDRSRVLRGDSAERLHKEARDLQRRVQQSIAYGTGSIAGNDLQYRVARLEQKLEKQAQVGRYGNYGFNGYNRGYDRRGYGDPYAYGQKAYGHVENKDDDHDRYGGDRHGDDDDADQGDDGYGRQPD